MEDLTQLTDPELADRERAVKIERERRENLDRIPEQVTALARVYMDGGGDKTVLVDALD